MSLLQFIQQSGNVVTRRVSAAAFQWMLLVSNAVDLLVAGGAAGAQAQTRYVDKAGNDTTGTGSFALPFLTIQRAITSITDASATKPYSIVVAPGVYTGVFTLQPWMFIDGADPTSTVLAPVQANWIGTGFSAAGVQKAGIDNCFLGSPFAIDFTTMASPGAGQFSLSNCFYNGTITGINATGNNVSNLFVIDDVFNVDNAIALACNINNIFSNIDNWFVRGALLTFNNTAAYSVQSFVGTIGLSNTLTLSCASTTNTLIVAFLAGTTGFNASANIVLTGDGVQLRGLGLVKITAIPDANSTIEFSTFTAGATKGINGGTNQMTIAATADRTLTINSPVATGTRLVIKNTSVFFISLTFVAGTPGGMSYIPPFGTLNAFFVGAAGWEIDNMPQSGSVTLSNGVSVLIPADIAAGSDIVASLRDFNGGVLGAMVSAKLAGRVVGTRAGGGGFVLTSVTTAGATVATDQGIYDWHVQY